MPDSIWLLFTAIVAIVAFLVGWSSGRAVGHLAGWDEAMQGMREMWLYRVRWYRGDE